MDGWFRSHPLIYALLGAAIVVLGAVRGQPLAIVIGVFVVIYGVARAVF